MSQNQDIFKSWLELFNSSRKNELVEVQINELLRQGFIIQNYTFSEGGEKCPTDLVLTTKGKNLIFKK